MKAKKPKKDYSALTEFIERVSGSIGRDAFVDHEKRRYESREHAEGVGQAIIKGLRNMRPKPALMVYRVPGPKWKIAIIPACEA